ncbi:MAG: VOC family protein [Proteobacteria bacterium]|nr:VOC family protein [Pseudomonadota bacterium]MDA1331121.1 VOC family protein [Pseudomonadota bacterium]
MTVRDPFHLACPAHSLSEARRFYAAILGCTEGRSSDEWIDFNFYGHQIVAHLVTGYSAINDANSVDGDDVPVRHFGVVLSMEDWSELSDRLKQFEVEFLLGPHVRFKGFPGEQAIMFVRDFSGNALEFKAFKDLSKLFDQ